MIEPCCDVKIKHSRYNVKERTEPKRPCCSKIFEKFKSPKKYNVVVSKKHTKNRTKHSGGRCCKSNRKTKKKKH